MHGTVTSQQYLLINANFVFEQVCHCTVKQHDIDSMAGCMLMSSHVYRYCAQTLEGAGLGHESTVWAIAFDREGTRMASCSADQTVKVWSCEMKDGAPFYKLLTTIRGMHDRAIFSVNWSASGCLATGCGTSYRLVMYKRGLCRAKILLEPVKNATNELMCE